MLYSLRNLCRSLLLARDDVFGYRRYSFYAALELGFSSDTAVINRDVKAFLELHLSTRPKLQKLDRIPGVRAAGAHAGVTCVCELVAASCRRSVFLELLRMSAFHSAQRQTSPISRLYSPHLCSAIFSESRARRLAAAFLCCSRARRRLAKRRYSSIWRVKRCIASIESTITSTRTFKSISAAT